MTNPKTAPGHVSQPALPTIPAPQDSTHGQGTNHGCTTADSQARPYTKGFGYWYLMVKQARRDAAHAPADRATV